MRSKSDINKEQDKHSQLRREKDKAHRKLVGLFVFGLMLIVAIVIGTAHGVYTLTERQLVGVAQTKSLQSALKIGKFMSVSASTIEFVSSAIESMKKLGYGTREIEYYFKEHSPAVMDMVPANDTGLYGYVNGEYIDGMGNDATFDPKDREWYKNAINGNGETVLSKPYKDAFDGKAVITISKLLDDGDSVIAMDVDLDVLQRMMWDAAESEETDMNIIIDVKGNLISHSDDEKMAKIEEGIKEDKTSEGDKEDKGPVSIGKIEDMVVEHFSKDHTETMFNITEDGEEYLVFASEVYGGWYAVTVLDKKSIMRPTHILFFATMFVTIFAITFFVVVYKRTISRIEKNQKMMDQISTVSDIYVAVYDCDFFENTFEEVKSNEEIRYMLSKENDHPLVTDKIIRTTLSFTSEPDKDAMREFLDFETLDERLSNSNTLTQEFRNTFGLWRMARFIVSKRTDEGNVYRLLYTIEDIDRAKRKENRLIYTSQTDLMTGVRNRGSGENEVRRQISMGKRGLFCLLDIDDFKTVNDGYGHSVGDKAIVGVADALKKSFRDTDIIMRLGGDEFAVFALGIDTQADAKKLVDGFIENIKAIDIPELSDRPITVSIGATLISKETEDTFDAIYKRADGCTYLSKGMMGMSYCTFCNLDKWNDE